MKRSNIILALASLSALAIMGSVAVACGDDAAVKEDVQKDAGTTDSNAPNTIDGSSFPGPDGSIIGPDGAIIDDCVAKPDPNSYTDLLNACTTSYKVVPKPVLPLLFPDGGLPPLP